MTDRPKPTLKGRLIAFGVSALLCAVAIEEFARGAERNDGLAASEVDVGTTDQRRRLDLAAAA